MPKYAATADIDTVVWITSLKDSEQGVTRRILEDLEPYLLSEKVEFRYFDPQTVGELRNVFTIIAEEAASGQRPLIHFDTHGGETTGIHIAPSNEDMSWDEVIDHLRAINLATENNLCVISLACYGFKIIRSVKMTDQTPFFLLAGSESEIPASYIQDTVVPFYRHIFDNDDVVGGFETHLKGKLRILHSEQLAYEALARYIRAGTMGEGKRSRVEDLVTAGARNVGHVNRARIRAMRKVAKEGVKPTQALVNRMIQNFLVGKTVHFNIDEVTAYARTLPDPYADGTRRRPSPLDHL